MKIRNLNNKESLTLLSVHLVGRAERSDLRIDKLLVSSQHAEFRWTGSIWEVHDLDSRNGTYLNGHRIASRQRLERGMRVAFGDPRDEYEILDTLAPVPRATRDDGEVVKATGRVLILPDPETPELSVHEHGDGRWIMEPRDGERSIATDGQEVSVAEHTWTLHLPIIIERTWQANRQRLALRGITLKFEVGCDGKNIDILLMQDGFTLRWVSRAHHKLLLYLAEQRLEDQADPDVTAAEAGWAFANDVLDDLEISDNTLHQYIYRARSKLDAADVFGAPGIIERRHSSKQLRIGISRLVIVHL